MIGSTEKVLSDNHKIYWDYLVKSPQTIMKCQVICTDIHTGWLNGVISHEVAKEEDIRVVVEKIVQFFKERGDLPFSWWVEAKQEPLQLAETLKEHQIVSLGEFSGMIMNLNDLKRIDPSQVFAVEKIEDAASMTEMIDVLIDAYEADAKVAEFAKKLFWEAAQQNKNVLHFIGREDRERPVSAGSLFIFQDVACIYHIGTVHSARKKGYASYLMYQMLETAKKLGCVSSVLVSTPAGEGMYRRLGYNVSSVFHHYMKL
jgi:GNAT superfamily N-acetyltransferase